MPSNTERGRAFQNVCRHALEQVVGREFDLEVPFDLGGIRPHSFDLASRERDIIAECKAFSFTATGNNPSAKITTLREAAMYLRSIKGDVTRVLMLKHDPHPKRGETLGHYFVRLNAHHLGPVVVLELPESGGTLDCIYGRLDARMTPKLKADAPLHCTEARST